jgi:hypothetical protein
MEGRKVIQPVRRTIDIAYTVKFTWPSRYRAQIWEPIATELGFSWRTVESLYWEHRTGMRKQQALNAKNSSIVSDTEGMVPSQRVQGLFQTRIKLVNPKEGRSYES